MGRHLTSVSFVRDALPRRAALGIGAAAVLASLTGCGHRKDFQRYKITLQLVGNGRIYQGSSVWEKWYTEDPFWFPSDGASNPGWRGEAVVVDIEGAFLFGVLDGYTTMNGPRERSFGPISPLSVALGRERRYPERRTGKQLAHELRNQELRLSAEELPMLAVFDNIERKTSANVIQPHQISEIFPGIEFGISTIAFTDEPTKFGRVERVLPWINDGPIPLSPGSGSAGSLSPGNFIRTWR